MVCISRRYWIVADEDLGYVPLKPGGDEAQKGRPMMRIKRKFLQPFTRQQHVYQKNGGVDSSNDRLWAPTKGMIGELLCSWNSCSWLDGGKAPNVDAAEMQAFGSKEDDAATKLQSLQRAKSTREVRARLRWATA